MTDTATAPIEVLQEELQEVRNRLIAHPLYHKIQSLENLKTFTQHHIFAVWDFMTLLKALQIRLTCVTLPWKPVGDAETRYLINEIVTGEESDVNEKGIRSSHYELYLRAMQELGADASETEKIINEITVENYQHVISITPIAESIKEFLLFTFDTALNAPTHVLASVFTFGREDLIPDMFIQIVRELSKEYPEKLNVFKYYLERHIEVDGDEHSILGRQMVEKLCGNDPQKWQEATTAAIKGLEMREQLWNGVLECL